jgi:hypothetical protein
MQAELQLPPRELATQADPCGSKEEARAGAGEYPTTWCVGVSVVVGGGGEGRKGGGSGVEGGSHDAEFGFRLGMVTSVPVLSKARNDCSLLIKYRRGLDSR